MVRLFPLVVFLALVCLVCVFVCLVGWLVEWVGERARLALLMLLWAPLSFLFSSERLICFRLLIWFA